MTAHGWQIVQAGSASALLAKQKDHASSIDRKRSTHKGN
jgi:hypothetical protein